ncbi:MAG: hypothetical protein B5766_08270 [Candidatus Lumbricidophila eiseniae]|uniref:Uncharacterized protein n=1 Tax=Candidatus Lumbricidiphila eiseniae TaxID=1969409 RepID=A0A2A6FQ38_9MICO|nr:MAG: hypothetical protein B5766_08270 [Candidatus Lumbricidophila eiseniae]
MRGSSRLWCGAIWIQRDCCSESWTKSSIEIPKRIQLAIRPCIGGPICSLWAQFRYRISSDGSRLGYTLERPENVLEAAFVDILSEIRDGKTDAKKQIHPGIGTVPIFYGHP